MYVLIEYCTLVITSHACILFIFLVYMPGVFPYVRLLDWLNME